MLFFASGVDGASGWLLLIPPVKQIDWADFEVDEKRPYADWEQRQAFDTAKECEAQRNRLTDDVWRRMIEREQKLKTEQTHEDKISREKEVKRPPPSKTLLRLRSEVDAALDRVKKASCGASDVMGSSRECESMRKILGEKVAAYARQAEKELQMTESKEETEKRLNERNRSLEKYAQQMRLSALERANLSARCLPADAVYASPTK